MKIEQQEGAQGALVADCDLFSTVDGRVVEADDPDANILVARAGQPIPDSLAESLGIKATEDEDAEPNAERQTPKASKRAKE